MQSEPGSEWSPVPLKLLEQLGFLLLELGPGLCKGQRWICSAHIGDLAFDLLLLLLKRLSGIMLERQIGIAVQYQLPFEPVTQLLLVSEAFVVGSKYAQALRYEPNTQLHFWIRWSGLRGRKLVNRNPIRDDYYRASAPRDKHVQLDVTLPIEPSKEEVIQKTTKAVQHLGRAFGALLLGLVQAGQWPHLGSG